MRRIVLAFAFLGCFIVGSAAVAWCVINRHPVLTGVAWMWTLAAVHVCMWYEEALNANADGRQQENKPHE